MSTLDLSPLSSPIEITVDAATVVAEAAGDGPVILALHAGVADRRVWRPVAPYLTDTHRLITYDRRGYGDTAAPDESYDPVADLVAVLDHFGVDEATLVGNSMGGTLAVDAVLAQPDRVSGLVLMAPGWSGGPYGDFEPEMDDVIELFQQVKAADDVGDLDEVNRLECHVWLDGPRSTEGRVAGDARELFLVMNRQALDLDGSFGTQTSYPDAWELLPQIDVPVAVVQGNLDEPGSAEIGAAAAERMGATFELLEGVAHLPSLEVPERLARIIADVVTHSR